MPADDTRPPEAQAPRRPDAIRCPRDYPFPRADPRRDVERNRVFGPLLGCKRVHNRELIDHPDESFVVANLPGQPLPTLLHPHGHPRAKEHRYAWFIAVRDAEGNLVPALEEEGIPEEAGRIKLGYLLPDEHAEDPEVQARIASEYERRLAEAMNTPERLEVLKARGVLSDSEFEARIRERGLAADRPPDAPPRVLAPSQEPGEPLS
jgi:hypothetical protein